MFQTALPRYAGFHAAARCLSGGPVVITDVPGDHDVDLIQQMTATTPNNHSITLRPSSMAAASDPYMSYTSSRLLRITNVYLRNSSSINPEVVSFVGFFNISMIPARDLFRLSDFDGLIENFHYITRSYRSGHVTPPVSQANADGAFMTLHLEPGEWDILTAVPAARLLDSSSSITCYIGTFGLSTNMTGAAAVTDTSIRNMADDNGLGHGVSIQYSLSALGTLCKLSYYPSNVLSNEELY
jgi:Raffinose synthase or seed imbibition protein Sip1